MENKKIAADADDNNKMNNSVTNEGHANEENQLATKSIKKHANMHLNSSLKIKIQLLTVLCARALTS